MQISMNSITFREHLGVMWETFRVRLLIISRYKGALVLDIVIPTLLATMPILLGSALAGSVSAASQNFQMNTGLSGANYVAYIIIGANVFSAVSTGLWLFGFYVRREQVLGTLESIAMSPAHNLSILGGLTLYTSIRSLFTSGVGYVLGCFLFTVNPFQGEMILAIIILIIGLIPIYGLSFLLGALILKIKEANSLINTLQWGIAIIMGVFYPVTVLPPYLQVLSYVFPGFYLNYDIQAALIGLRYFFGSLYLDLAVIFAFVIICPMIGYFTYARVEGRLKKAEGIGQF